VASGLLFTEASSQFEGRETMIKQSPTRSYTIVALIGGLALSLLAASAQAVPLREAEARAIAVDAYVYGYPLITMEISRR
jgi:hypothetical protein